MLAFLAKNILYSGVSGPEPGSRLSSRTNNEFLSMVWPEEQSWSADKWPRFAHVDAVDESGPRVWALHAVDMGFLVPTKRVLFDEVKLPRLTCWFHDIGNFALFASVNCTIILVVVDDVYRRVLARSIGRFAN
jgi:hypothetical protein